MEVLVYAVYLLGFMAAFSALIVQVFARLPTEVAIRGARNGRVVAFRGLTFRSRTRSDPARGGR